MMPKITGNLAQIALDLDAALRDLDRQCTDILLDGAKEWTRTVVDIVPTWSGMSQASIQPIADLVGVPVFSSPVSGAPDRQAAGRASGSASMTLGERGEYSFEWKSTVFHFLYNELNDATEVGFRLKQPGPYQSQRQASAAFFRVVNPRLRQIQFNLDTHVKVIRNIKLG